MLPGPCDNSQKRLNIMQHFMARVARDAGGSVPEDAPDWWQSFFDDAYVEAWETDGAFESTQEEAMQLIEFLGVGREALVLDIPCGFGRFSGPLHQAGLRVVGVDSSADQIRLAQERNPGPH